MSSLVWFRGKELRADDHAPLRRASELGEVAALFVIDPYFFAPRHAREMPHRVQFLLDSLHELQGALARLGLQLLIVRGKSVVVVPQVAKALGVKRVLCQRWVEPFGRKRDRLVSEQLDVPLEVLDGETLLPPGTLRSGSGTPYVTFTPFARSLSKVLAVRRPQPARPGLRPLPIPPSFRVDPIPSLDQLGLSQNRRVFGGGRSLACLRMASFREARLERYPRERDEMARAATSHLSADLKFGSLSPVEVYHLATDADAEPLPQTEGTRKFRSELFWREFTHSTLWDFPELLERPYRREFLDVPWRDNENELLAWKQGSTGYPIVDAAARQLLLEGFVENRARMIAASFLTKHLMLPYWQGEAHYLKYLVDGDWAQNNYGWQWSAGCGVGASPYFRMMNPMTQAQKFDPDGAYVRKYVPELAHLPSDLLVAPWESPPLELATYGVHLGRTYPRPIVDHRAARERYLRVMKAALSAGGAPEPTRQ